MINYKNVLVLEYSDLCINASGDNMLDFNVPHALICDSDLILYKDKILKDRYGGVV